MVRKLKFHEQKLLKKVDFISWEVDNNIHEVKIMRRYCIQKREDYTKYNKLSRHVRELARKIKELDAKDPFRTESSAQLLEKLYMMGLIPTKWDLSLCDKVNASCFCRRRLPVIMMKSKMCGSVRMATKFVQQGHVRVGSEVVKDPAFLVTSLVPTVLVSLLASNLDAVMGTLLIVVFVTMLVTIHMQLALSTVQVGKSSTASSFANTDDEKEIKSNSEDFVTWVNTSAIRRHIMEYNEMRDDFEM